MSLPRRDVKAIVSPATRPPRWHSPSSACATTLPLLGVVRPGATAAALATRNRRVGVIATQATVRSRAYFQAIKEEDPFVEVFEQATPKLVPLVEAGQLDGGLVEEVVAEQLAPLLGGGHEIDTLLLGCTHYPLLAPVIRRLVGADVAVIDSAQRDRQRAGLAARGPWPECADRRGRRAHPAHHRRRRRVQRGGRALFGSSMARAQINRTGRGERLVSGRAGAIATRRAEVAARRRNDRAAIGVGIALGAAGLAIASRYIARRAQHAAGDGLVDWDGVRTDGRRSVASRTGSAAGARAARD